MARMLVSFGGHSRKLRCAFARLTMWLANGHPPWEAYEAMMIGRLVGFDKMPGVIPLGIGDIIRRLIAKCGLKVMGQEATRACGTDQLCAGLEAGIEGGIHFIRQLQDEHLEDPDPWGMLLIDAKNAFNEGNRKMMAWVA